MTGAAFVAIPVGSGAVFTIGRDSAGALKVAQSKIVVLDSDEDFPAAPPQLARLPNSYTTIGYVSVKVGTSGAAWTFGASNLAGPPTDDRHRLSGCRVRAVHPMGTDLIAKATDALTPRGRLRVPAFFGDSVWLVSNALMTQVECKSGRMGKP